MLNLIKREKNIKAKRLRREGMVTGTLKRLNGENILIQMLGNKIDQYLLNNNFKKDINLKFEDEEINVKIINLDRDILVHNVENIDFKEV